MSAVATKSANFDKDAGAPPFAAFVVDDETAETLKTVAEEHGWDPASIQRGGIANAVRTLTLTATPELMIVDLSESEDARSDIAALADVCEEHTMVIALGEVNDVHLYRDLTAGGVFDYLVKPITTEMIEESIVEALEVARTTEEPRKLEEREGDVTLVVGIRGGVGASTVAVDLAWNMAHALERNVALADLDIYYGSAALAFDLEPGGGLREAMANPGRIDSLFLDRAIVRESERLAVLGSEAPLSEVIEPDHEALHGLLDQLHDKFDQIVIDVPRHLLGHLADELTQVKRVVLVVDYSLTSVRDTIRVCSFLKENAPSLDVVIVANRTEGEGRDLITKRDFEGAVERKVDWVIPGDPKAVSTAQKTGKAIASAAKRSKVAQVIGNMAQDFVGEEETEEKEKGLFKALKRRG